MRGLLLRGLLVLGAVSAYFILAASAAEQSDYDGIVRGRIVREGKPVSNIKVTLENELRQQYEPALTDITGTFVLSAVKPGKYTVVVGAPGSQPNGPEVIAGPDITEVPPIELTGVMDTPSASFTLEPSPAVAGSVTPAEARAFVKSYLTAHERGELDRLLAAFAQEVDYYQHGVKDKGFILKDQRNYLNRYTNRTYELGAIDILKAGKDDESNGKPRDVVRVRFSFRYKLSGKNQASGSSIEDWILQKRDGKLQIVDCKYKVFRD